MNYNHLTIEERCCIHKYYKDGLSLRKIAELVGRNVSTISREIRRNCTHTYDVPTYYPHTAQKKAMLRSSYRHRGMFWNKEVIAYIEDKLLKTWSPEQISNAPCEIKLPSFKTIYRWIYQGYLDKGHAKVLRRKGKTKYGKETRGKYNLGKSIRKMDKSVYRCKEAGHWEADTVVSGAGKSTACFVTLAERKTRYYIAIKVPNRKADTVAKAIIKVLGKYPGELVKSITCDRGSEFAKWEEIEKEMRRLFANTYCAWQKGSNENSNGLLREFYPKGRNLSRVSKKTLKKNLALINARPRKVLHYQTAEDLWNNELQKVLHFI